MVRLWLWLGTLLAVFLSPEFSWAGAANATLACKSDPSGKTAVTLRGDIPGDTALFAVRLQIGSKSLAMTAANGKIYTVIELNRGVFTMVVAMEDGRNLLMYAVPESVKHSGGSRRLFDATFDAIVVQAPKPGHEGLPTYDSLVREIRLACTLGHTI